MVRQNLISNSQGTSKPQPIGAVGLAQSIRSSIGHGERGHKSGFAYFGLPQQCKGTQNPPYRELIERRTKGLCFKCGGNYGLSIFDY